MLVMLLEVLRLGTGNNLTSYGAEGKYDMESSPLLQVLSPEYSLLQLRLNQTKHKLKFIYQMINAFNL